MDDLEYYRNRRTGEKFFLFGFANYITDSGVNNVVIFHPENEPNALYVMDIKYFDRLYTKWKSGG